MRAVWKCSPFRALGQLTTLAQKQHLLPPRVHGVPIRRKNRESLLGWDNIRRIRKLMRRESPWRIGHDLSRFRPSLRIKQILLVPSPQSFGDPDRDAIRDAFIAQLPYTPSQLKMNAH